MIEGFILYGVGIGVLFATLLRDFAFRFLVEEDQTEPKHPHPFWWMLGFGCVLAGFIWHVVEFVR